MQEISCKLKIDYDKYLKLKSKDKLTVQKFLIRENKKFIAKFRPHLARMESNTEQDGLQSPILKKAATEMPM